MAGRYRPVSYPDGPITVRYRFIKNGSWVVSLSVAPMKRMSKICEVYLVPLN